MRHDAWESTRMEMGLVRSPGDHGAGSRADRWAEAAAGRGEARAFFANALLLAALVGGCLDLAFISAAALDGRFVAYMYSLADALNWQRVVYPLALGILLLVTVIGWLLRWEQQRPSCRRIAMLLGWAALLGLPLGVWLNLWLVEFGLRAPLARYPGYTPQRYPLLRELDAYRMYSLAALGAVGGAWLAWRLLRAIGTRAG